MLGAVARRLFGSANDRLVKSMRKTVDTINALEPSLAGLVRRGAAGQDRTSSGSGWRRARALDDLLVEAFAVVREAAKRTLEAAPFRRAADRRHGAAQGRHRRDADRRGQDPGRHAGHLPQRAGRPGRARGHGERLPGPPRRRLDGRDLPVPRHERGRDRARPGRRRSAATPMPATSPTAPTTSSASTICATTCATRSMPWCSAAHHYAIVDEVDSILVDEARTPLIISGPSDDSSELYRAVDKLVIQLHAGRLGEGREAAQRQPDRAGPGAHPGPAGRGRPAEGAGPLRHRERLAWCTTPSRRCARTRCSAATSTTSSRTARSSSSTSSPAA